jgi:hypothetical protein
MENKFTFSSKVWCQSFDLHKAIRQKFNVESPTYTRQKKEGKYHINQRNNNNTTMKRTTTKDGPIGI